MYMIGQLWKKILWGNGGVNEFNDSMGSCQTNIILFQCMSLLFQKRESRKLNPVTWMPGTQHGSLVQNSAELIEYKHQLLRE